MANRFNDRDRSNDRDREEQNYFPRKDRERFRSEGQQGRSQDWRNDFSGQEDMDWYQTSGSQYPTQYGRGQDRYDNRSPEIEGSRFHGHQERFGNQELNRGRGEERQYGRGFEQWEDPEASRWGLRESSRSGNMYSDESEGGYRQQGQQRFNQGFNQSQGFSGEGQESWRRLGGQQSRFRSGQQFFGTQGTTGRFAGRGPKNYRRSDDRILEDINERLTQDPDIDASEIEIQVIAGEVILLGTVEERETKRKAEDIAESVFGVNDVQNQIKVSKSKFAEQTFGQQKSGLGSTSSGKDKGTSNKDK